MKIDLTPQDRGYVSNILRRRAEECRANAKGARVGQLRLDRDEEAAMADALAKRFDDGDDEPSDRTPSVKADPRSDIDYLDDTGRRKVQEFRQESGQEPEGGGG